MSARVFPSGINFRPPLKKAVSKDSAHRLQQLQGQSFWASAHVFGIGAAVRMAVGAAAGATFTDDNWTSLGSGLNNTVQALAVSGSDLYAGGKFTMAGSSTVNYIAKWNGTTWSALGSGVNGYVRALVVSGTNLYVGGDFTMAGATTLNHIARWNGSSWSALC